MEKYALEFPLLFMDEISESMFIISDQNFFAEIRLQDNIDGEFVYWIIVVTSEPHYVFLGDRSYL